VGDRRSKTLPFTVFVMINLEVCGDKYDGKMVVFMLGQECLALQVR